MGRLSDHIKIAAQAARSVNLERDSNARDLDGYVPTSRAVDTLQRIVGGLSMDSGTRAWSITGPYGSGKSFFAVLLDSLCAPAGDMRKKVTELLDEVAPDIVDTASNWIEAAGIPTRAAALATIEPIGATVARGLHRGAKRRWPARMPHLVRDELEALTARPDFSSIRRVIDVLAGYGPVVVTVDEFGKNLEYHMSHDPGQLFLLQELAELFSGAHGGCPGGLLTLQHLAFEDYASSLSASARREWAKVQGRFEDISYVDTPDQVVRLIADTIRHEPLNRAMGRRLSAWTEMAAARVEEIGLTGYLGGTKMVGRCYPLHPVAAAAIPELCSRYGQYERTLASFLASGEDDSVVAFCARTPDAEPLATVGLAEVYDYFVTSARTLTGAAVDASRWLEIEGRINQALVDDEDLELLKIVGVLNLLNDNGPLRASALMVAFACDVTMSRTDEVRRRLAHLAERGVIAFRGFADEYRLWNGTDFDVSSAIADAREMLSSTAPAQLLSDATNPVPVIAGRHSQTTGILRYFDVTYADPASTIDVRPSAADGTLVYVLGNGATPTVTNSGRPVVFATSGDVDEPVAAGLELAAIVHVLRESAGELAVDWVARRELHERAAQARAQVTASLAVAFHPSRANVEWICDGESVASKRGPSGVLSDVCDKVFASSPVIRNEMVARRELTSQGAKARRVLLEAMLAHEGTEDLGIVGYGPERAMYHAVLDLPGFYRPRSGHLCFGAPHRESEWAAAWSELGEVFTEAEATAVGVDEVYRRLGARPFGVPAGVIPIVLAVALLHRRDDIAIYERGTYQPRMTADLLDRLVHNPDHFKLKNFAASVGERRSVIEALGIALSIDVTPVDRRRNSGVLALIAPLLGRIRALPEYTLSTRQIDPAAIAVRDLLLSAREPDIVLFRELPAAVGVEPELVERAVPRAVRAYARGLAEAVEALQSAWRDHLIHVDKHLRMVFGTPESATLREDLAARAKHIADRVLDRRLQSFLVTACEPGLSNEDWLEAVALTVVDKPVVNWKDADWPVFVSASAGLGGTLKRLEALNYELIAQGSTEFTARRFTITNPDGTETSRVVVVDPAVDAAVESHVIHVVEEALDTLDATMLPAFALGVIEAVLASEESRMHPIEEEVRRLG